MKIEKKRVKNSDGLFKNGLKGIFYLFFWQELDKITRDKKDAQARGKLYNFLYEI